MQIILARPRGFCAGVERAIRSVEKALERFGAPIYVLNDIVHNATVVQGLAQRGVVFVRQLSEVPAGAHLLFSAHGVAPERWDEARALGLNVIDATCPLVEKVHREAARFAGEGDTVVLIGDRGHDEVVGTAGWAGDRARVILRDDEVASLQVEDPDKVAYVTQTTLTMRDCDRVVNVLRDRFPKLRGPNAGDICYATQNRQMAVTELSDHADLVLVVGDKASANSRRLADICRQKGKPSHLLASASELDPAWFSADVQTVVITSGASAPESLVCQLVERLQGLFPCEVSETVVVEENLRFALPKGL